MAGAVFAAGLLNEGFAVNALANGRVCFMGGNAYLIERAVIFVAAVILALLYGTFDGGIGRLVFHYKIPS